MARYCTLLMVMPDAYNAIVRSLAGWAHIDPSSVSTVKSPAAGRGSDLAGKLYRIYRTPVVFLLPDLLNESPPHCKPIRMWRLIKLPNKP